MSIFILMGTLISKISVFKAQKPTLDVTEAKAMLVFGALFFAYIRTYIHN